MSMKYTLKQLENERWCKVKDYTDYHISDLGRCKSFRQNKVDGRLLKPQILRSPKTNYRPYHQYRVYADTTRAVGDKRLHPNDYNWLAVYAHRLVWQAFGDEPLKVIKVVHHIDNDPSNNSIGNLAQVSYSRNLQESDRWEDPHMNAVHITIELREKGWTYQSIADLIGVSSATVWRWCAHRQLYLKELGWVT